ncbi:hypothetical protein AVANS14531_03070 [Campylobacter sp. Cr9]|uniref:hypothetical protein n=1 Tax=Campylobacter sp. Cr9 TaxID=2735728 RepID=UPI003014E4E8|nr:hypothetical protein [Campylobacter sp. Cr9]
MSKKEDIKNVLNDKQWHCVICDLNHISSQSAAIVRDLAKQGAKFCNSDQNMVRQYKNGISMFCNKCHKVTTHRKLE